MTAREKCFDQVEYVQSVGTPGNTNSIQSVVSIYMLCVNTQSGR
jgi:hypothetical protein